MSLPKIFLNSKDNTTEQKKFFHAAQQEESHESMFLLSIIQQGNGQVYEGNANWCCRGDHMSEADDIERIRLARTHYEVLGVPMTADLKEIKKAYP